MFTHFQITMHYVTNDLFIFRYGDDPKPYRLEDIISCRNYILIGYYADTLTIFVCTIFQSLRIQGMSFISLVDLKNIQ